MDEGQHIQTIEERKAYFQEKIRNNVRYTLSQRKPDYQLGIAHDYSNKRRIHFVKEGVPEYVKEFDHRGEFVFRHYFPIEEMRNSALAEGALIAGPTPYAIVSRNCRSDYCDLVGVFMTTPDVDSRDVGVANSNFFIDFKLPPETDVLEIEKGKIYLIPGMPKPKDLFIELYNAYINGEDVPQESIPGLEALKASGFMDTEPLHVYFDSIITS